MNKYIKQIRKIVLDNQNYIEKLGSERDVLLKSYHDGNLAKNDYERMVKEIDEKGNDRLELMNSIHEIAESYKRDLNDWAILKASDLTDDIKLFSSPIEFTAEDYEELESKYQTNYSMLKAIHDHAIKNNVDYVRSFSIDKEDKLNSFNQFVASAQNIINTTKIHSMNYTGVLWDKEGSFNEIYADTSRFIQTNEGSRKLVNADGSVSWA